MPSPTLKFVPSLLAPFSRTTPCRLSLRSGLITAINREIPAKFPQILRLIDIIKSGEELQIIAYVIPNSKRLVLKLGARLQFIKSPNI